MVDACIEAYECTNDGEWITDAYRSLNWYLGDNDRGLPLYDPFTGGCRDGLGAQGVNENEGAESTLSWLMSLLSVYELRGRSPGAPGGGASG